MKIITPKNTFEIKLKLKHKYFITTYEGKQTMKGCIPEFNTYLECDVGISLNRPDDKQDYSTYLLLYQNNKLICSVNPIFFKKHFARC